MNHKALVLGCGRIGTTIAKDLAADESIDVTVADMSADNLARLQSAGNISVAQVNVANADDLGPLVKSFDIVVGALPSALGFQTLRTVIEAGKHYCDISFMPEDATALHELAQSRDVTAVVDCGVAPGLSHIAVGHGFSQLDTTDRAVIFVGGLPFERHWPFQYKAPFAPLDVLEEYTRPARVIEHGQVVTHEALSGSEFIEVPRVGTLEALYTDGLRSLLTSLPIPTIIEKTLRYPGHAELMRSMREAGYFSTKAITVGDQQVVPRDVTAALLFPHWKLASGEREFTFLRVDVTGTKAGQRVCHRYELFDEYDAATDTYSMARTTAFPAAIIARLIVRGEYCDRGVSVPENLGKQTDLVDHLLEELSARGVTVNRSVLKHESV